MEMLNDHDETGEKIYMAQLKEPVLKKKQEG
jgi:hypothetical protein